MSDKVATVTASGIASLAGVGRAAVSNWRRRYADFPSPWEAAPPAPPLTCAPSRTGFRSRARYRRFRPRNAPGGASRRPGCPSTPATR